MAAAGCCCRVRGLRCKGRWWLQVRLLRGRWRSFRGKVWCFGGWLCKCLFLLRCCCKGKGLCGKVRRVGGWLRRCSLLLCRKGGKS